jgi:hypothetical protein
VCRRVRLEPAESADPATGLHSQITLAWFVFWGVHVVITALVAMLAVTWLWVRGNTEQPANRAESV